MARKGSFTFYGYISPNSHCENSISHTQPKVSFHNQTLFLNPSQKSPSIIEFHNVGSSFSLFVAIRSWLWCEHKIGRRWFDEEESCEEEIIIKSTRHGQWKYVWQEYIKVNALLFVFIWLLIGKHMFGYFLNNKLIGGSIEYSI